MAENQVIMVDIGTETVAVDLSRANDATASMRFGHLTPEECDRLFAKCEEESKHLKSWEEAYALGY